MAEKRRRIILKTGPEWEEKKEKIRARVEESLRPLTLPNFITMIRMAMLPFFLIAVREGRFLHALGIFILAGLTDALDGTLARTLDMTSRFGTYLDPLADKLLLVTAFVVLSIPHGQRVVIPFWLMVLALSRDVLIILVALGLYLVEGVRNFRPSVWGKATTFIHVVTVIMVLAGNVASIPLWLLGGCFWISGALVLISGFNYIYRAAKLVEEVGVATEREP